MRFKLQRCTPMPTPGPDGPPLYFSTPTELRIGSALLAEHPPFHGVEGSNGEPIDWDLTIAVISGEVIRLLGDRKLPLSDDERIQLEKQAIANIERGRLDW